MSVPMWVWVAVELVNLHVRAKEEESKPVQLHNTYAGERVVKRAGTRVRTTGD